MHRKLSSLGIATAVVALITSATPAQGAVIFNDSVPFAQAEFVPCAGEDVLISGNLHVLITLTIDNNGGVHTKSHFQPQGATGVGTVSGDTYRAVGVTQDNLNINSGGLPITFTLVNNFRLIGPGPGNNLQVHLVVHVTIDENGVFRIKIQNNVTCK